MRIHVEDIDGKPIAAAKIHVSVWTKEKGFKHNRDYTCDSAGNVDIELPKKLNILRLWARKDRYAPLFAHWEFTMRPNEGPIPDEFSFKMTKGAAIGGTVKDEDGKPVSGARVEVMNVDDPRKQMERVVYDTWLAEGMTPRSPMPKAAGR